ncbi:MAG: citramalate synthase [Candidatus Bipolaricaulis sp.]|nr:citramalate synthase [Candidatus Bipolaricaulis sp.]
MRILLYDTTLRDGAQQEGLSFSVADKLSILKLLDRLGIDYVEGGWPGSNPKDAEFFDQAVEISLEHAKLTAFGCTCRVGRKAADDANVRSLLAAGTSTVAVFGKSWGLHVERVLRTTREENLRMVFDTVRVLAQAGREVIYDAEHFFDGYRDDRSYALETLSAAAEAGAASAVLCDTNGGSMPWSVAAAVRRARRHLRIPLGIHAHNDAGLAVANSLAAVRCGATSVQGTFNGYGERCGNADLCSVIPALVLKLGHTCISGEAMVGLTPLAREVSEIVNRQLDAQRPYVGSSAFAHKGGVHVDAVAKCPESYQHVEPARVGNRTRTIVSELAGRANIAHKAAERGIHLSNGEARTAQLVARTKELERQGLQFEGADASVELLIRKADPAYRAAFDLADFHVLIRGRPDGTTVAEAAVKVDVDGHRVHTAADGNGPVNALDRAVRKALLPFYPELEAVRLTDYKVRILDGDAGTAARIRVLVTTSDGTSTWSTVGCGTNVIEASWMALVDALEYALLGARCRDPRGTAYKDVTCARR